MSIAPIFGWTFEQWACVAGRFGREPVVTFSVALDLRNRWMRGNIAAPLEIDLGVALPMDYDFAAELFGLPMPTHHLVKWLREGIKKGPQAEA